METIFGHLVTRFGSSQAENIATDGLNYVLGKSAEARQLFIRFLQRAGRTLPANLSFTTQVADSDGAIPDLVGRDAAGVEMVLVEAKFWAGLTTRQPTTYLARLPLGGPAI